MTLSVTQEIWVNAQQLMNTYLARIPYVFTGCAVIILFWLLGKIARFIIDQIGDRTRLDAVLLHVLGSIASFVIILLGFLVAAVIIFPSFRPGELVAGLGITTVAIGFAFKDMLQNTFAGLLILWRKPFRLGDEINTKGYEGTVEEINIRSTFIKTYDGERVVVPNADIYTNPVLVRTAFDKRRVHLMVSIGYEDSIAQAITVINEVLEGIPTVLQDPGPWIYTTELAPSSVNLEVYFWTRPQQANILRVRHQVATDIKLALDKAGIDIPYPHEVVLFHNQNGCKKGDLPISQFLSSSQKQEQGSTD
jgi:small conductance mechanosensitive channel